MIKFVKTALVFGVVCSLTATAKTIQFVSQDSPPFHFLEGVEPQGAAPDIVKAVCKK